MKKIIYPIIISICIICSSCAIDGKAKKLNTEYRYGVISSSEQNKKSKLIELDSDLNIINTDTINYANIGGCQFYNSIVRNNIMYEISLGPGFNNDNCSVLGFDLESGTVNEYKFDNRVNITDYAVTDQYIYTISNLNYNTYVDRYSFQDKKIDSYIINNSAATDMCICQDELYVFVDTLEDEHYLYHVDITNQICEKAFDLTGYCNNDTIPSYYEVYEDKIYLPCDNCLLELTLEDFTIHKFALLIDNAFGSYSVDNLMYISCVDIHDENDHGDIIVFDMKKREVIATYNLSCSIEQFIIDDNFIIVLGLDDIVYKYQMQKNNCTLMKKTEMKPSQSYFSSALFVKR